MTPQTVLLLALLVGLIVAGSRLGFGRHSLPEWLRPVADTGAVFILLGALIGPQGLNLLTAETLGRLGPLLVIGLGWIGFLFGSHFEWRLVRRYPAPLYRAAFVQAGFTFLVVAAMAWGVLALRPGLPPAGHLGAALILGICASGTAPAGPFLVSPRWRVSHGNLNALRFFAAVDDLPAMVLLGVVSAVMQPGTAAGGPGPWGWLGLLLLLGVALGVIAHWVFPGRDDARHNALILLGVVALGAGAADRLGLSPLFVTTLGGLVFANLSHTKESAYGLLAEREHSLYAVFLLVAGVLFRFDWGPSWYLVPLYVLTRAVAKVMGGWLGWRWFLGGGRISPLIGSGLLFQGGMALAMAVSYDQTHGAALAHQITTTIVVAVIVNELVAPVVTGTLLGRRGLA